MTRPLRVLTILGQRPAMTGSGVVVSQLWRAGRRAGDSHRLVCVGYPDDDWHDTFGIDVRVVTCSNDSVSGELPFAVPGMSDAMPYPSSRYRDIGPAHVDDLLRAVHRQVTDVLIEFKADVVHIHHLWVLTELARTLPQPCVVTVHGTDLQQARAAPTHRHRVVRSLPFLRHLFCVSSDIATQTRQEYGAVDDRLTVLGNGFDDTVFHASGSHHATAPHVVLCAGKFVAWKGFSYAIRACARLNVPYELVILGDGPAAARAALLSEANSLGVDLQLPGHLPPHQVAAWMRAASVFMLPSVNEPFGLVVLEAMACGCRIVAADSGGPHDIVSPELLDRGLATLVRPLAGDAAWAEERYIADLAAATEEHLSRPRDLRHREDIARTVRSRGWDGVYRQARAVYASVVDRAR